MAKRISQLPEETATASGDFVPLYDISTGTTKRSTIANLTKPVTDSLDSRLDVLEDYASCKAIRSSTVSIASGSEVVVSWNSEEYDYGDFHDNATNPSRLTIPENGIYLISGYAAFAATVTTSAIRFRVDGSGGQFFYVPGSVTTFGEVGASTILKLNASQYVEMLVFQSSGGAKNLTHGVSFFAIHQLMKV